jgi:hypothetical protein
MKHALILVALGAAALGAMAFEVSNVQEEIPEAGTFTRTRVTEGKTVFSFIAPNEWTASMEPADKLYSLHSGKLDATFNLRLLTNNYPASAAKFKEQVAAAFNDVNVADEFSAASGSGGGYGLDMRHVVAGKFGMNTRVAVFPTPEGALEVSLSTPSRTIESLHSTWVAFLNSVRIEKAPPKP